MSEEIINHQELIDRQRDIVKEIEKQQESASKLGKKRTREKYLKVWKTVFKHWKEFQENHEQLELGKATDETLNTAIYFTENKYLVGTAAFNKAKEFLLKHFPDLVNEDVNNDDDIVVEVHDNNNETLDESKNEEVNDQAGDGKQDGNEEKEEWFEPVDDSTPASVAQFMMKFMQQQQILQQKQEEKQQRQEEKQQRQEEQQQRQVEKLQEQQQLLMEKMFDMRNANSENAIMSDLRGPSDDEPRRKRNGLRAPTVEIPMFYGEVELYQHFKATFNAVVEDSDLTTLEKFTLLKTKVGREAAKELAHLQIHSGNYEKAWQMLDEKYDDKGTMIYRNIDNMLYAQRMRPGNAGDVQKLLNLLRTTSSNLENLEVPADTPIFIRIIMSNFDSDSKTEYARCMPQTKELAKLHDIEKFLKQRYNILVSAPRNSEEDSAHKRNDFMFKKKKQEVNSHATLTADGSAYRCYICFEPHLVPSCPKLAAAPNKEEMLRHYNMCTICLRHRYVKGKQCSSKGKVKCDICKEAHHTMLHGTKKETPTTSETVQTFICENETSDTKSSVILPTAVLTLMGKDGVEYSARCLMDLCSQSSYISEEMVQKLRLRKKRTEISILGVGGIVTGKVTSVVTIWFRTKDPGMPVMKTKALVVKKVTRQLPHVPKDIKKFKDEKELADPYFGKSAHVPILLGANILPKLYLEGTEVFGNLMLQNTKLGWIVSGSNNSKNDIEAVTSTYVSLLEFDQDLQQKWDSCNESEEELEEFPVTSTHLSTIEFDNEIRKFWDMPINKNDLEVLEDDYCEKLFMEKHHRTEDGRYVVPIPWKPDGPKLGNSYQIALKYFLSQERRWYKDPEHKKLSDDFMKEYISMGHMSQVAADDCFIQTGDVCYISYLSVLRRDAVTTKLRNVFNGALKTSNGIALNQTILPGPNLGALIFEIITRIRQFQFIYSSDITKMYRQILHLEEDRRKLRILWRENAELPLKEYQLNTVTYGLDCAPYQAQRVLKQVARDNAPSEEIRWIIENSFFMDDLIYGGDTVEQCQQQIQDITETLDKGKLPLTKWMSNNKEVLANVEKKKRLAAYIDLEPLDTSIKTLGIRYFPHEDSFGYKVKDVKEVVFTKRGLLSLSASIFDPLGFLSPVAMKFKIMIQHLWLINKDWDEVIEADLEAKFRKSIEQLPALEEVRIPRWMGCTRDSAVEVIGFSDASGDGYAAVLYSRVKIGNNYQVRLLVSKSRVTPLKTKENIDTKQMTIPKMELESINLLTDLFQETKKCFKDLELKFTAYTDSEVALAWIRSQKEIDNKFIKRRVMKIRKVIAPADIHHVKSKDNPADCASRSLEPKEFVKHKLWFEGPEWLKEEKLPQSPFKEIQETTTCLTLDDPDNVVTVTFIEGFSSFERLIKAVARILKWKTMALGNQSERKTFRICAEDVIEAKKRIVLVQQNQDFKEEKKLIQQGKNLPKNSWIRTYAPFIDEDGILRVGGRIERATTISEQQKHPILLQKGHLATLIVRDIHEKHLHAGNLLTERLLKEEYWTSNCRGVIKKVIRSCKRCIRIKGQTTQPEMSDLPVERVTPGYQFEVTGLDFCGPFNIRASKMKFEKIIKVWVACFICLVTKMVHLEICTDLTTDNFLAAFDRFTSRRSSPRLMESDNGTTFVGASRVLREQYQELTKKAGEALAIREVKWRFIPPGSPSMGGIWESSVRSFKGLAKRMTKLETLTYEEFYTLTCRIESQLNSRPLTALSNDPSDELALTPSHFAVQRCIQAPPSSVVSTSIPITRRWQCVRKLQQEFWARFSAEYLTSLQQRHKWTTPSRNIQVNDVVLLKDNLSHPLDWPMGKVINCHPDPKGTVRIVDVQTKGKQVVRRAVNRLVPLLTEEEQKQAEASRNRPITRSCQPAAPPAGASSSSRPTTRSRPPAVASSSSIMLLTTLCIVSLFCPVTSVSLEALTPGLHVRKLDQVDIKALNVGFTIQTNINITEDFDLINSHVDAFKKFCREDVSTKAAMLLAHCEGLYGLIEDEAKGIKESILNNYSTARSTRFIGFAARYTVRGMVKKAVPALAVGAAFGWQEYENWSLKKNLHEVETKFNKVSFILLNITEIEHEAVNEQLDNLANQQQLLLMESEINDYASTTQALITSVMTRHQDIVNLRPHKELEMYVESLNSKIQLVRIPQFKNKNDIFTLTPVKKQLRDELVTLLFDIPLVQVEAYTRYAVISIPRGGDQAISLDNNELVQVVAMSKTNDTYFYPCDAVEVHPKVFDHAKLRKTATCASSIIRAPNENELYELCVSKASTTKQKIFSVAEEYAIVIKENIDEISVVCQNMEEPILSKATFIELTGCKIAGPESVARDEEITINAREVSQALKSEALEPPKIELSTIQPIDDKIADLKKQLITSLNTTVTNPSDMPLWLKWTLGAGSAAVTTMISGALIVYLRKKLQQAGRAAGNVENWR